MAPDRPLTEAALIPHWFPFCTAEGCGWVGPSWGTTPPSEPFTCGGCGRLGDAWKVRALPPVRVVAD